MKNRQFENKFMKEQNHYFCKELIPLIEIVNTKIGARLANVDELLEEYDDMIQSHYLVDFFTFDSKEYKKYDPKQVVFSLDHRDDTLDDYNFLLEKTIKSRYAIPVISIKHCRNFLLNSLAIQKLIIRLQNITPKIAVRIQSNLLEKFFMDINPLLRENDLLIYDINEESIHSKFFDRKLLKIRTGKYKTIVLSSPRPQDINNGSYIDGDYTGLIDNSIRNDYRELGFDGFADYAGLKNTLPTGGGNGQGAALGLFYVNEQNQFFSIMNSDTKQGTRGHEYVVKKAFCNYKTLLDPKSECPAFEYMYVKLHSRGNPGSWGLWKYITILRYISQIKNSL